LDSEKHVILGEANRKAVELGVEHVNSEAKNEVNILVFGSGSSFHYMQGFFDSSEDAMRKTKRFNNWLQTTMQTSAHSEKERTDSLIEGYTAPDTRYAQPRDEHIIHIHI